MAATIAIKPPLLPTKPTSFLSPPPPPPPPHIPSLLRLSYQTQNLRLAQSLHSLLLKYSCSSDDDNSNSTPLFNHLISTYISLDRLSDARKLLLHLPAPDVASFTPLISALCKSNQILPSLHLFHLMRLLHIFPNSFTFVALLTSSIRHSPNLPLLSQLHSLILKSLPPPLPIPLSNALISAYLSCGLPHIGRHLFDQMPQRDISSYNIAISCALADCMHPDAFILFRMMLADEGNLSADRFSVSTLLTAATRAFSFNGGEAVHAYAVKVGLDSEVSVGNTLLTFYTRLGSLDDSVTIFERMPVKDVISWTGMFAAFMEFGNMDLAVEVFRQMPERSAVSYNVLLAGFCKNGEGSRGLRLFREILDGGIGISDFTLMSVVKACGLVGDRKRSEQVHGFVVKVGLRSNDFVGAALLDMYARCGRMDYAEKIYEQTGRFSITWNSLIFARTRNGQHAEALSLFQLGLRRDDVMEFIDEVTLATVLGVCGSLGFTEMGKQMHCFAVKLNTLDDIGVCNAIVSMYYKCGSLDDAVSFFNQMTRHDLVSWNALLNAYLLHRKGEEALGVWLQMQRSRVEPDHITFLLIISACKFSNSDSTDKCKQMLDLMLSSYSIKPSSEHYAATVDVLSYWCHFDEAMRFIESMPFKPDALVWRALLDNCRLRSNFVLGRLAAQRLLALEPKDPSSYILVSNIYSSSGRWHCSERVRHEMRAEGLKKDPARSWLIHQDAVHMFYGRDRSHLQSKDIYSGLEVLILECTKAGYVPDMSFVLQEAEDYQRKHFLFYHSAKLAVTYGLLMGRPREVVKVVKNVRLCGDCHQFLKIVSSVTRRKILVRDGSGFHRFEGGECFCGDSW